MAGLIKDLIAESKFRGNEYFLCDRFRCRLLKSRCLERQGQAPWRRHLVSSFAECRDCQQGREIRLELTGSEKLLRPRRTCLVNGCDEPHTAFMGSMQKPVGAGFTPARKLDQIDQAIQETNDLRRELSQAREKVGYLRGLLEAEQERLSDLI